MKIKKSTSIMMITASAVAVVGVAAVSFAAWTGSDTDLTASAATGNANLFGFTSVHDTSTGDIDLGTLVPYDQPTGTYNSEYKTVSSVALPEYVVDADYKITVSSTATVTLYVLIGSEQTAVPDGWSATNVGDWKEVTASGATFNLNKPTGEGLTTLGDGNNVVVTDTYVSLMLVSGDADDMNQSFTLNVTLSK